MMFFFKVLFLGLGIFPLLISASSRSEGESYDSDNNSSEIGYCSFLGDLVYNFLGRLNFYSFPFNTNSNYLDSDISTNPINSNLNDSIDTGSESTNIIESVGIAEIDIDSPAKVYECDSDNLAFVFVADNISYYSYADSSDTESDNEDLSPTGQWTRLSSLLTDIGPSEDLYYHVEITLTYGFKRDHPAYNYAKKFLKACKKLEITPNIGEIISNRRLALHIFRLGISINEAECQEFKDFVFQTVIPDTSILYEGDFPLDEITKWKKQRKIITELAREEIERIIIMEFDAEKLKELIGHGRSISKERLDKIVDSLADTINCFIASDEIDNFVCSFETKIHFSIKKIFRLLRINDESLMKAIKTEIRYLFSSPLNLVFNYNHPKYFN